MRNWLHKVYSDGLSFESMLGLNFNRLVDIKKTNSMSFDNQGVR